MMINTRCLAIIAFFFLILNRATSLTFYFSSFQQQNQAINQTKCLANHLFTNISFSIDSPGDTNLGVWMDSAGDRLLTASQKRTSAISTADAPVVEMLTDNSLKKVRLVVGLSVGVLEFLIILLGIWFWKKNRVDKDEDEYHEVLYPFLKLANMARKFSYGDLVHATNNFSEKDQLGKGGFGSVYKGFLKELNCHVAVKRLSRDSKQGIKEFASEVKIGSQLRHRNIVRLIGWCCEQEELLLVYEFMANGSLDSHLFKQNSSLSWETRFKIAHEVASGLLYLHDGWEQYVVHRDVKASNIMLDSNFNAKIGDFGLARFGDHGKGLENSCLEGTIGYVAPEYATFGRASKGSDVFSFGSVALEIACGRKVIDRKAKEDQINLREWVWSLYGKGKLLDAVDPKLNGEFDKQQVECLMIVGFWCAHPDPSLRPTIHKAIHVLKFVAPLPDLPSEMPMTTIFAPFSTSSGSTDLVGSNNQSPKVGCNYLLHTVVNFSKHKKRGDLLAFFRGFRRELNFGFANGDFEIFRRFQKELNFDWRTETSIQGKMAKRKSFPLNCTALPSDNCRIFSITEISSATNCFDKTLLVATGRSGNIYKGFLDEKNAGVAIKRWNAEAYQGREEVETEISVLTKLNHCHVVSLIGYCLEKSEMVLVYEYMAQGALSDHLYKTRKSPLPWKQRLKICIAAAKGLHYLQTGTQKTIIHRDIKSSNILLDNELVAKISDFGLSTILAESDTDVKGSFGYLDPEYLMCGKPTEKSDLYSFGVVLFEVLCARPAMVATNVHQEASLADWALYNKGNLNEIIDPYLKGKIAPECFKIFTDIAIRCLAKRGSQRPSMGNVLHDLELAMYLQVVSELQENIAREVSVMIDGERSITFDIHSSLISGVELSEISFLSDDE